MLTHVLQRQLGSDVLPGCGNRCSSAEELQFEDAMRDLCRELAKVKCWAMTVRADFV